jgi:hypothetical protein
VAACLRILAATTEGPLVLSKQQHNHFRCGLLRFLLTSVTAGAVMATQLR